MNVYQQIISLLVMVTGVGFFFNGLIRAATAQTEQEIVRGAVLAAGGAFIGTAGAVLLEIWTPNV